MLAGVDIGIGCPALGDRAPGVVCLGVLASPTGVPGKEVSGDSEHAPDIVTVDATPEAVKVGPGMALVIVIVACG